MQRNYLSRAHIHPKFIYFLTFLMNFSSFSPSSLSEMGDGRRSRQRTRVRTLSGISNRFRECINCLSWVDWSYFKHFILHYTSLWASSLSQVAFVSLLYFIIFLHTQSFRLFSARHTLFSLHSSCIFLHSSRKNETKKFFSCCSIASRSLRVASSSGLLTLLMSHF